MKHNLLYFTLIAVTTLLSLDFVHGQFQQQQFQGPFFPQNPLDPRLGVNLRPIQLQAQQQPSPLPPRRRFRTRQGFRPQGITPPPSRGQLSPMRRTIPNPPAIRTNFPGVSNRKLSILDVGRFNTNMRKRILLRRLSLSNNPLLRRLRTEADTDFVRTTPVVPPQRLPQTPRPTFATVTQTPNVVRPPRPGMVQVEPSRGPQRLQRPRPPPSQAPVQQPVGQVQRQPEVLRTQVPPQQQRVSQPAPPPPAQFPSQNPALVRPRLPQPQRAVQPQVFPQLQRPAQPLQPPQIQRPPQPQRPPRPQAVAQPQRPPQPQAVAQPQRPPQPQAVAQPQRPPQPQVVAQPQRPPQPQTVAQLQRPPQPQRPSTLQPPVAQTRTQQFNSRPEQARVLPQPPSPPSSGPVGPPRPDGINENSINDLSQPPAVAPPSAPARPPGIHPPGFIPPSNSVVEQLNNADNFMEVAQRLQLRRRVFRGVRRHAFSAS